MPSPERLARRSVAVLARQGLPRGQAAEVVIHVCDDAAHRLYLHDRNADMTWIAALRAEARAIWQREITRGPKPAGDTAQLVASWADRVHAWALEFDRKHQAP